MKKNSVTEAWEQYTQGVDFKSQINLYATVDENIRFYEGDQWHGISAPNLPMPVFNMIKPACRFSTVQIKDRKTAIKYTTDGEREDTTAILNQMNDYAKRTWNRLNMETKNLDGLTDAFNTGDYILYHWWNTDIETGQPFDGDIDSMIIDNVNYYPGNPNSSDVQSQPYIILVMREMVTKVREEAKNDGVSAENIKLIVPDEDTEYVAGDIGKVELEGGEKCNVLLKMWKQDGQVWFGKWTKHTEVMKPAKANLKLYPISIMNWMPRKNCCHGVAETTYMKANQVYINKQMAFTQLYLLQTAYPKVIYNKSMFPDGWSNKVASAIGVNGGTNVNDVAKYMQPPQMPSDVWVGFDKTLKSTMDLMGVNDAAMGNISNPNNKSAFVAVRDAAVVPLESQQQRYHQQMRDTGIIWLDFWINHYPEGRTIPVDTEQGTVGIPFDMANYEDMVFDVQLEVGESQLWSELNVVYTLDNLLQQKVITFSQYLKRMPDGYIPDRDELMQEVIAMEQQQQQLQAAQAQMGVMQ